MPWFGFWSDVIKNKVCRYLLQRYLGKFLEDKLTLEQLNVDFLNGTGTVYDVSLYCKALNELCEQQGWCVEVTNGHIGSVTVTVPWNAIMSEDGFVEVRDLCISLRPLAREKEATSMLDSMWSMSSSMQLAQECLEKEGNGSGGGPLPPTFDNSNPMEGLERFAQTIDNILKRVKAKFINSEIRLEYISPNSECGIAIVLRIDRMEYQNEAGGDPPDKDKQSKKEFLIAAFATHNITIEGITFYTEEFRVVNNERKTNSNPESLMSSQQFHSTIADLPPDNEQLYGNESFSSRKSDDSGDNSCSDCDDDEDEETTLPEIVRSEPIQIAAMAGCHEIRITIKQSDDVPGPRAQLDINFASLVLLLSPRHYHHICVLAKVFGNASATVDQSKLSGVNRSSSDAAATSEFDFQTNLQARLSKMSGSVGLNQGWSSDANENTFPITLEPKLSGRRSSDSNFSSGSSMTSSMSSSFSQNSPRYRRRIITGDPGADVSKFLIRLDSCAIVLMHEDILVESALDAAPLSEQSVEKMKIIAETFFGTKLAGNFYGADYLKEFDKMLNGVCKFHHLRLILSPITLRGDEQRNENGSFAQFSVCVSSACLKEKLIELAVPLLEFNNKDNDVGGTDLLGKPEIEVKFRQTHRFNGSHRNRRLQPTTTEIEVILANCQTEIDISMADRLRAYFDSPFDRLLIDTSVSNSPAGRDAQSDAGGGDTKIEIKLTTDLMNLKLRFPIADLRPLHDPNRVPWWSRNVRPDFLTLTAEQLIVTSDGSSKYEVAANIIHLQYFENDKVPGISIAKAMYSKKSNSTLINYPRVTIEMPSEKSVYSARKRQLAEENSAENTFGDRTPAARSDASPFSSKKVCRESDTPHESVDDAELLILPGDRAEINQFCTSAKEISQLLVRIVLPVVSVQLKSKHLYEIIYNRINSDLLLWEPSAPLTAKPAPTTSAARTQIADSLMNIGMMDSVYVPFKMCKSQIDFHSSSSGSNSDSDSDSDTNLYQSIYEKKRIKRQHSVTNTADTLNAISFQLDIGDGVITMFAPVRDAQNLVIPQQSAEFVLCLKTMSLFSVNGFQGNPDLGYLCLQAKSAELYHCGIVPLPSANPPLKDINCALPEHVQSTLYPTRSNLTPSTAMGSTNREQISVAIEIRTTPGESFKRIRLSAGIQATTLRHNPAVPQNTWLNQLIDMFDVVDYPVEGYTSIDVVTEMHLHLWECAIDYRPRYLPYRAVATLSTFMISTNIVTAYPGCTLRFIAEDCTLSLAPYKIAKMPAKKLSRPMNDSNRITVLPASELVCVLDLGLFEISLRLSEKATSRFPKFDMRTAINGVHVRTCSDSGAALAQLIAYIAAEGDLHGEAEPEVEKSTMLPMGEDEEQLLPVKQQSTVPEVTQTQQLLVNTLMAEALQDEERVTEDLGGEPIPTDRGVEVFYFPDETGQTKKQTLFDSESCVESKEQSPYTNAEGGETLMQQLDADFADTDNVNPEMRELLDFESSVMGVTRSGRGRCENESVEALQQVTDELGDITKLMAARKKTKQDEGLRRKESTDTDEDFCIIADEERVHGSAAQDYPATTDEPIRIVDNHFSVPMGKPDLLRAPQNFPMAVMRYTLCEMSLTWYLYGGRDFPTADEQKNVKTQNDENEEKTETHSHVSLSVGSQIGVLYSKWSAEVSMGQKRKLSWRDRGGIRRKHDEYMEIQISKVRFSHETYPTNTEQASRQVLLVTEVEIRDRLAVSNINKFLYQPSMGPRGRNGSQYMVVIKALHLRPNVSLPAQECCLRISLLPLRLNIDQDTLLFLVRYFNELGGGDGTDLAGTEAAAAAPPRQPSSPPIHQPPVMIVELPEAAQELQARKMVSENLMLLMDEEEHDKESDGGGSEIGDNAPIYFRNVVFSPEVPIRLDYNGKRVELSHGPLAGLLMGLGQLQCSSIRLKKISHRHGILGFDKLINFLLQEWLHDIKKNQLPSILGGVGPMYSFVQLFQGIRDLFWLPIEQYQKDGRIVRGLQRGAQSFTARTALAALELTTRIIYLLQVTAETAFDMVSPGPSVRRCRRNRKGKRKRIHPPQDIREGVSNAYQIIKEGIGETAHTIVEVATVEHDQKGYTGAIGAVVRQIPPTMVRPIVLATQATSNVLGGVINQLIPEAKLEAKEKWKNDDE